MTASRYPYIGMQGLAACFMYQKRIVHLIPLQGIQQLTAEAVIADLYGN